MNNVNLSKPDGISLRYLLDTFKNDTKAAGLDWTKPKTSKEWYLRLMNNSYIDATSDLNKIDDGYVYMPELFIDSVVPFGRFKTSELYILPNGINGIEIKFSNWRGKVTKDSLIKASPIDVKGNIRYNLFIIKTASELCLIKTRDLVDKFIGNSWNHGITSELKATYLDMCKINAQTEDIGNNKYISLYQTLTVALDSFINLSI